MAVARSLARFQVGEAGEGRIAREIWKVEIPGVDDDYRVALGLFVKEEGRHARILGALVSELGGGLLSATWTERLFVFGRRLVGPRLKLLVLLSAEVVGIGFYGLLADRFAAGPCRSALREICADEERHLAFHVDFFRRAGSSRLERLASSAALRAVGGVALLAVLLDHRATLREIGLPLALAARRLVALLRDASADVADTRATPSTLSDRPAA